MHTTAAPRQLIVVAPRTRSEPSRPVSGGPAAVGGGPAESYRRPASARRGSAVTPNYALRRVGAAMVVVCALVAGGLAVEAILTSFGGVPASAAGAPSAPSRAAADASARTRHVAQPGDTLWSIASTYRGAVSHDRYLDALIRLNGGATQIEVGQAVRLP